MDTEHIAELLKRVQAGNISVEEALGTLKKLPFEDLDYAKIDHHRGLRQGYPEGIFCQGKTIDQIKGIVDHMVNNNIVLATRAGQDVYDALKTHYETIEYNEAGRIIVVGTPPAPGTGQVLVISAGTSDIPVAEEAARTAEVYGNRVTRLFDVGVSGIHRLFSHMDLIREAHVIIAVAGMEGALPSVVGGHVSCPVIAVPTSVGYGASLGGIAALLAMLNSCAANVVVVNIDAGFKGGYVAGMIAQRAAAGRGVE